MGDKCSICHEKVYLLERHIENAKLYHRSCYRRSELSPQTRLSKRQQQRGAGEDAKDFGKFRKLEGNKNESNNQPGSSGQDFWQRRAELKAKGDSSQVSNQNSNSVTKVDDTPAWKKTETTSKIGAKLTNDTTNDVVMQSPKSKAKFDKKSGDSVSQSKQTDRSPRPNRLADKFKELNDRNLKSSQLDQNGGKSNNTRPAIGASGDFKSQTSDLGARSTITDKNEQKTPIAKPRLNVLGKHEKMDTSETPAVVAAPHPRPVPRFKVKVPAATEQDKNSNEGKKETPRSKTPTKNDVFSKSGDVSSKISDISSKSSHASSPVKAQGHGKPKTPPFKHKESSKPASPRQRPELTFKSVSHKKEDDMSPSSPPPLPSSVPPKLPVSSPPHLKKSEQKSPTPSPRQPAKSVANETKVRIHSPKQHDKLITDTSKGAKVDNVPHSAPPSKPPRISTNLNETGKSRDITPMETDTFSPAKAVFHDPKPDQKAFVSQPKRHNVNSDNKEGEVFGGLLKSLADVRTKYDAEKRTVDNSDSDKKYGASQLNVAKFNKNEKEKVELRETDRKHEDGKVKFSNKTPQRPKSSFVSGRSEVFLHDVKFESHTDRNKTSDNLKNSEDSKVGLKSKVTEKTVVTTKTVTNKNKPNDNIKTPVDSKVGVKSKVQEKTVVTTKTTTTVGEDDIPEWKRELDKRKAEAQRPKSTDVLSNNSNENDNMPEWQKEAEKRRIARQGGYVDPEKVKVDEKLAHNNKVADKNTNSIEPFNRPLSPPQKKAVDIADRFVPALNGRASPVGKVKTENKEEPKQKRKILPVAPERKDDTPKRQPEGKKKISVGTKFVFDEIEVSPKKPQRVIGQPKSPGPPRPPQPVVNKVRNIGFTLYLYLVQHVKLVISLY